MSTITNEAIELENCVDMINQGEDVMYLGPDYDEEEIETMDYNDLVRYYSDMSGGC